MKLLKNEYFELINIIGPDSTYANCLNKFVESAISIEGDNISSIILFGGLVRDKKFINGWSDIDILIIFNDLNKRNIFWLSSIISDTYVNYDLRLDITQIGLAEVSGRVNQSLILNGEILNCLAMRKDVSLLIYGDNVPIYFSEEVEREVAIHYISNTILQFRRYLIENIRIENGTIEKVHVSRIIKWIFSILRSYLRIYGIYAHTYEYLLPHLNKYYPGIDFPFIKSLLLYRQDAAENYCSINILNQFDNFINDFQQHFHYTIYKYELDKASFALGHKEYSQHC